MNPFTEFKDVVPSVGSTLDERDKKLLAPFSQEMGVPNVAGVLIKERLGSGGMATVYKGQHLRLAIPVAVKIITKVMDENDVSATQEARMSARVNHPNVVRVYDVNIHQRVFYIIQEYVDGGSGWNMLERYTQARRLIPESRALEICADAARGLQAIHSVGIIHRDVKPDNLLIRAQDGVAKVADLGLGTYANPDRNSRSALCYGTPGYMSPEQIMGGNAGPTADVYALGATLFEFVTGQQPFNSEECEPSEMILHKQLKGEFREAGSLRSDLSAACGKIISRAMQLNPDDRYPGMNEMLTELIRARELLMPQARQDYLSQPRGKIACVDDDPEIRLLLQEALSEAGHDVVAFEDGPAAVQWLKRNDADLAILDVEMPFMTGIDVCTAIRELEQHRSMPVLFLSLVSSDAVIESARLAGATDYLEKPFQPAAVLPRVQCLIQLYRVQKERMALAAAYNALGSRFSSEANPRLQWPT